MGKSKQQKANVSQDAGEAAQPKVAGVVGLELKIQKDYLDMKDIPDENGLPHAGYLVLRKGECVHILYGGGEPTGDAGWLYGEVTKSIPSSDSGRRGWLPDTAVNLPQPPRAAEVPKPPPVPAASMSSSGSDAAGAPLKSDTGPGPPAWQAVPVQSKQPQRLQLQPQKPQKREPVVQKTPAADPDHAPPPPPSATMAAAFDMAVLGCVGGKRGKTKSSMKPPDRRSPSQQQSLNGDFPALPGQSGKAPSWWHDELEEEEQPPPKPPAMKYMKPPSKSEVERIIAGHRAMAAAAAAEAQAKKSPKGKTKSGKMQNVESCPICMEPYGGQVRRAELPCCGVAMCAGCSERSLRSKRCYFCREGADEFPSLMATAGSSLQAY